jgi:uncharacterized protein
MGFHPRSIDIPVHIQTPLFNAITANNIETVKDLIDVKCNLKWQMDDEGYEESPLIYAAEMGRVEILQLMLGTTTRFSKYLLGRALVDAALNGHLEATKILVTKGVNLNLITDERTPLTAAVYGNHLDIIKFLVEAGAEVEKRDGTRFCPLSMAAHYGYIAILYRVRHEANPTSLSGQGFQDLACTSWEL